MLGKFSHNAIIENIYSFVIELFTPTINPIHEGVLEVHSDLHRAIMGHDEAAAVKAVERHTAIWMEAYRESMRESTRESTDAGV
jgi:DNA-binding FadR family transcriptional regulator